MSSQNLRSWTQRQTGLTPPLIPHPTPALDPADSLTKPLSNLKYFRAIFSTIQKFDRFPNRLNPEVSPTRLVTICEAKLRQV